MSVIVYSKKNCPACERLKAALSKAGTQYEVKNIDTDLDAMDFIVSKGHRAMPVVYENGEHVSDTSRLTTVKG